MKRVANQENGGVGDLYLSAGCPTKCLFSKHVFGHFKTESIFFLNIKTEN